METKKDIYNLWVQYTTKNEESYFRQFISGFVTIWKSQLQIDFTNAPKWSEIKPDSGPLLSRLPDELLPAIGKFIIIARDEIERDALTDEKLFETNMLVECLVIICRHFDNISTVAKYDYIANLIAILTKIYQKIKTNNKLTSAEVNIFTKFSNLLEVIYDPYFTWRNFLQGDFAEYRKLSYKPNVTHVEIVPFIYDCFQSDNILQYSSIGTSLVDALSSIIAGSQRNGMRAICPATVSVIIKLISKWECNSDVRHAALKCCCLMMIVLQRSSPEERQIELVTIIQQYCDAIIELMKTTHFCRQETKREPFEIASDSAEFPIDVNGLIATVDTVRDFISEPESRHHISNALIETNIIEIFITIPNNTKDWSIDHQNLGFSIISTLCAISRISKKVVQILKAPEKMDRIFDGLKSFGKPTEKLLKICFDLAFDNNIDRILIPEVLTKLVEWIPEMNAKEQNYLSATLLKGCACNYVCKSVACEERIIKVICQRLLEFNKLSQICIQNLIKLIEELAKHSITPVELKLIFWLLREKADFPQSKQLFQTIVTISLHNLNSGNACTEFLDIQNPEEGIIVPDIRNWTMSGSYGFIFHALLRLDKHVDDDEHTDSGNKSKRRMLFTLMTYHDTGFEIFIQQNGTLVVAAITKREYLTSSVLSKTLLDGRWHFVTISITPPKRPFSYSQINVYVDFIQKLSATLKAQPFNEPFTYCAIGSAFQNPRPSSSDRHHHATSHDSASKSMLPNLIERTFFPQIASHVPNYFTLPLRNTGSFDPNVKNFPVGMQDNIFGEQICLKGQIGAILLAEPTTNMKVIFDAGANFASIFSQDNEILELTSKFVFCYSATACSGGICIDLVPSGRFNGSVLAHHCKTVKIQDTINSIGGIQAILPILKNLTKKKGEFELTSDVTDLEDNLKTPTMEEFSDWEILSSSSYAEWKMIQHPLAGYLCFLRYLAHDHDKNQENLINTDSLSITGSMLAKCSPKLFDVHALMATHLFIESMQNQKPSANMDLLDVLYSEIVFNFNIWSRMQFQITLGHVQYLSTMIKDDRKYFRKKFGIQFFLDIIRQYYSTPDNISLDDAVTIRSAILNIIKYYIQKEVSIKEIGVIISFLASVKHEHVTIEVVEMLRSHLNGKNCKDQMFLLLHEPQTADLLYNFFVDKAYSVALQEEVIKLIECLLSTSRVNTRYKQTLRLQDSTIQCQTLFPGFFSHIVPLTLSPTIISIMIDHFLLQVDEDYCGLLFLVHHVSLSEVPIKLEVAKKLLTTTFTKQHSPLLIAKQVGWQESISRLLIRKPFTDVKPEASQKSFGVNLNDVLLEDTPEMLAQSDLISFVEQSIEMDMENDPKDSNVILNEIQASVTEAANVIENEIKELAGSVSGAVAENFANVYSVIRQRTSEIQDTFESLAMGVSTDNDTASSRNRTSSNSSDEPSSVQSTPKAVQRHDTETMSVFDFAQDIDVDVEEQLVYLVTNILFTILWRGVSNDSSNSWKERGQVLACINLLGLNNELIASHLTLRLRLLEMGVQASLLDLSEHGNQTVINQEQNAAQILRMVYDLVVLDPNEDDSKKCSTKLLDGVLALLDALMVFQQVASDDWSDMIRLCLGLLLKCSHHPNPGIVAMATAKLHGILQTRNSEEPTEMAYLLYSINKALDSAIEVGHSEQYSFLMPVMKALLDKCRFIFNLDANMPDLPPTTSGPVFFNDFQMYSTSKKWRNFIEKKIKPLHDSYQNEIATTLWEPLNMFWAECYEACKTASQKRAALQLESRRRFQQKIIMPWRVRQVEEMTRFNTAAVHARTKDSTIKRKWKSAKRFLYGPRGPWYNGEPKEEFWKLSNHENVARMRLKLEPQLYPDNHENAARLRDNAVNTNETKPISADFNSSIKSAVVRDFLSEDENLWLEEEMRLSVEPQHQDVPLEKAVISQECELITLMTKVKGRLEVNATLFTFVDLSPPGEGKEKMDFRFPITKIRELHLRKYNLRRSALEIFLIDQTSYFLNFTTKTRNKIFTKILSLQPPNILYGSGRSPPELLRASGLTQKWVNREISNFEYLMYLNTIAGRSYNDLSQYPVFPWILADYTSEVLDLTDPKSFRDLSKPIGVINPKNEAEVRAKYEGFEDPSGTIPKFHYGTHYSNSAGVLHYLIRVEPFTSLHVDLQSGRFDVADRQFHSIPQTWKLLMDNPNDVKELIPEFFYFPEFLKNMNKFNLGQLQITKEKVDDVILPPWASSPEEFIEIHRRALESEYVSQNLHHWIDLIFGYKQKGPKAVGALNVFYYCSYEGAVDLDKIKNPVEREAVEGMINNFGQTPSQLLRDPHPKRLTQEETVMKLLRLELKRPDISQFFDRIVPTHCEFSVQKDPIIFLSVPRSPPRSFLQISPDVLVSISKSRILGCNSWISFDKDKGFLLEIDATTTNLKNRKRIFGPIHPSLNLSSHMFDVSIDGKYLYAAGIWDNSLRVYSLHKGKTIASVTRHLGLITCLALDNCGSYLVTGSKDCTCIVWSLSGANGSIPGTANQPSSNNVPQLNTNNSVTPKPITTLYGHDDSISCVAIYTELDLVVSGSLDGTVNVYTIKDGQFVRSLKPVGCTEPYVQISFITISYQGHIAFSALDDTSHSVHVYSVNGTNLGSKYVSGRVTGLTTAGDFLVVADDAGDITMSRLYGLKPVYDIPLHVPIQTVVVTPNNTHILAPLRDGRLAVIGVSTPTTNRKHSVLNV
ncbi:neurobeachin-like protein 1 isoform X2 [Hermetia illucens]|uniref:neurobeachin-like protein 1 isoform X2 n=1 Tax=Hermetia illucens TaxID=343691 RepID=UPI0018CC46D9|nr:neurobeachin-like protein 1 isoform X2 [Hermetia illucens]